jgi:acyl-coenzyme A synthetase/AMP-(fatty) acid ligase
MQDDPLGLVLTDTKYVGLARGMESVKCSVLDHLLEANDSAADPKWSVSADDIAAAFYTSGSTGVQKVLSRTIGGLRHEILTDTNSFHVSEDRLSLLSRNEWLDGLG